LENLKIGELTTKELVNIFGTSKLIERYKKEKRLGGTDKKAIIKKAKNFCNIEELGKGKYIVHKIYGLVRDDKILPLKKGLYNYLIPLILTKLIKDQDENYRITLPFLGWARKFEIINDNYSLIKYHQKQSSKYLGINDDIMFEYFEKIDDCIKYYLGESLNKLEKLDLIKYNYLIMCKKIYRDPELEDDGSFNLFCRGKDEILTPEEIKFVIDCENKAIMKADIKDPKEKFYGKKSLIYKKELKSLLLTKNILFTYSAYDIYCKNYEAVKEIINKFENKGEQQFVLDFNDKFIEYINKKAQNRYDKEVNKLNDKIDIKFLQEHRLLESYLHETRTLSEITIKQNAENIRDNIDLTDDIYTVLDQFSINIIKQ